MIYWWCQRTTEIDGNWKLAKLGLNFFCKEDIVFFTRSLAKWRNALMSFFCIRYAHGICQTFHSSARFQFLLSLAPRCLSKCEEKYTCSCPFYIVSHAHCWKFWLKALLSLLMVEAAQREVSNLLELTLVDAAVVFKYKWDNSRVNSLLFIYMHCRDVQDRASVLEFWDRVFNSQRSQGSLWSAPN